MKVRWTREALSEFRAAREFISDVNPNAARKVAARMRAAASELAHHPRIGRPGRIEGTRELVVSGTPFILIYALAREEVAILTVLHGAQSYL